MPDIFLADEFVGAANVLLDDHVPDTGGTWTRFFVEGADPHLALTGNGNVTGTSSTYAAYYFNTADPGAPNVSLTCACSTTVNARVMLLLRYVDGGTHYKVLIEWNRVSLYRVNYAGGTGNTLLVSANSASNTSPAFFRVDIVDNRIQIGRFDENLIDYTDTDPSAIMVPGKCGIAGDQGALFINLTGTALTSISTTTLTVPNAATATLKGVGLQTEAATLAAAGTSTATYNGVTFHTGFANMPGSGSLSFHGLTIQIAPTSAAMMGLAGTGLHGGSTRTSTASMSATSAAAFVSTTLPAFTGEWSPASVSMSAFRGSALKTSRLDANGHSYPILHGRGYLFGRTTWNVTVQKSQVAFVRAPMTVPVQWTMAGTAAAGFVSVIPSQATWSMAGRGSASYRGASLRATLLTGGGLAGSTFRAAQIVGSQWDAGGASDAVFTVDLHLPPFTPAMIRTVVLDPERAFYGTVGIARIVMLPKLGRVLVLDPLDRTLELPRINRYARLDAPGSRLITAREGTAMRWSSIKDPDDILDYTVDWTQRMAEDDVIQTSTFEVVSGTVTIGNTEIVGTAKTVAWISGGASGETASVRNRIVTAGGRQMDQTIQLQVKTR